MKYYILFGPPGAGKGTQAELMVKEFNLKHISTGDLLRKEIAEGTPLGIKAQKIIDAGNFVPDNVVVGMIENIFAKEKDVKGFILDGFPRTISQAQILDKILKENNHEITLVMSLSIKDSTIFDRISSRAKVEGRHDDADPATILNRIETYHKKTEPLINYYKESGKYIEIDGENSIESVFNNIKSALNQ